MLPTSSVAGLPAIADVPAVAAWLGLPESTVRSLAYRHKLPGFRLGKRWVFPVDALREWVSKQAAAHVAPPVRTYRPGAGRRG